MTGHADVTGNRTLAARARSLASEAALQYPRRRRAALSLAVCLDSTKTVAGARQALSDIPQTDLRQLAAQLLDLLASEPKEA